MSENVNFPGARRAGAYVETEDVPDVVPAAPVQARDVAAVEDEAIVEPSWEPSAEVSAAAPTVTTHESEGAAVPASPRGGGAMSVPAPAEPVPALRRDSVEPTSRAISRAPPRCRSSGRERRP